MAQRANMPVNKAQPAPSNPFSICTGMRRSPNMAHIRWSGLRHGAGDDALATQPPVLSSGQQDTAIRARGSDMRPWACIAATAAAGRTLHIEGPHL